jgi:hypothetical protein
MRGARSGLLDSICVLLSHSRADSTSAAVPFMSGKQHFIQTLIVDAKPQ